MRFQTPTPPEIGMTEEKQNWTAGPWSFRQIGDDGLGYIEADDRDIMHAGVTDRSAAENVANAHLIAAAPALYARGLQSAVTLEEAANVLEDKGLPAFAKLCREQVARQREALDLASTDRELEA
jgi:hypothetical protein